MLHSIVDVQDRIFTQKPLLLAGSDRALSQLPRGNWIGGSIPYFMSERGGICTETQVFVTPIPDSALDVRIREYSVQTLPAILADAPENGFSFVIIPAGSDVHATYAQDATGYDGIFLKPVVGWIAGVLVSELGQRHPRVFNGSAGTASSESAVVMHVTLPAGQVAILDILNVFRPGRGDTITFPCSGFRAGECRINGASDNLARYMASRKVDTRLPLTADYNGSIVNVSVQSVDRDSGIVHFYAPVFSGIEYRIAAPVEDYVAAFESAVRFDDTPLFTCNCILNYLYAELEGKQTGSMTGPITFGEIAHQLLNQTLVRLSIVEVSTK